MVLERLWLAFLPLFVAFDVLGLLPIYWSLTQGFSGAQRQHAVQNAVVVAFLVALAFLLVSGYAFQAMGIQMADVMIAGGLILFVLALTDLLRADKTPPASQMDAIGMVPLGVPLIVGPAVLTTVLLARQRYGLWPTIGALSLNILVTWVILQLAGWFMERLGREGARVISKVSTLVLAAFAVMLVRQGLQAVLLSP